MLNKFREAEAIIPYREQNHREHFHQGDPIRAVLKRWRRRPRARGSSCRRGDPLFVKALFKLEVPEIQQSIVEIRAIAREVGSRTKIAVVLARRRHRSGRRLRRPQGLAGAGGRERARWRAHRHRAVVARPGAVRPAGAGAGPGGARCSAIRRRKTIQAVVDEDQLSLAIGRNGQNVRLASELTGWKIDLYSSREWLERGGEGPLFAPLPPEEETADARCRSAELKGLSPELVAVLDERRLPAR